MFRPLDTSCSAVCNGRQALRNIMLRAQTQSQAVTHTHRGTVHWARSKAQPYREGRPDGQAKGRLRGAVLASAALVKTERDRERVGDGGRS